MNERNVRFYGCEFSTLDKSCISYAAVSKNLVGGRVHSCISDVIGYSSYSTSSSGEKSLVPNATINLS